VTRILGTAGMVGSRFAVLGSAGFSVLGSKMEQTKSMKDRVESTLVTMWNGEITQEKGENAEYGGLTAGK
jgi:hypothetical protein